MSSPVGMCCLCLSVSLKEPFTFIFEKADDELSHFDKILLSLSQLADVLSDQDCSNYKLCKPCCATIEMIYKFNNSCLNNVKEYPSLTKNLKTSAEDSPPVNLNEEVFIKTEHFLETSNNEEDGDEGVAKKEIEDIDEVMNICQVDMVIDNTGKIQQECFSGVFNAFLENRQIRNQKDIKDERNFVEQPNENYTHNVANNFKSELENKDDFDIEQVLGGHVIIAGANDEQPSQEEDEIPLENNGKNMLKRGRPFSCKTCNKKFDFKSTLHIHMLTHKSHSKSNKPYVCDICQKSYKTKVCFETHKSLHTGQKPYPCEYCNRGFRTKYILDKHKHTHIGEEPYECDFCNKVFRTRNQLMDHRTIHT